VVAAAHDEHGAATSQAEHAEQAGAAITGAASITGDCTMTGRIKT
jgi:hypothetical protein